LLKNDDYEKLSKKNFKKQIKMFINDFYIYFEE